MICLMKSNPWWSFLLMTNHSFQFFKIRIIQCHSLTMILIKLVIGVIQGKCLLTRIPQNKHKNWFFQGSVQKKIILPYILIIYHSPRLPFKSITRQALVAIYKAFIRSHLGYGDIVCDKPNNQALVNKTEKAQLWCSIRNHWCNHRDISGKTPCWTWPQFSQI